MIVLPSCPAFFMNRLSEVEKGRPRVEWLSAIAAWTDESEKMQRNLLAELETTWRREVLSSEEPVPFSDWLAASESPECHRLVRARENHKQAQKLAGQGDAQRAPYPGHGRGSRLFHGASRGAQAQLP